MNVPEFLRHLANVIEQGSEESVASDEHLPATQENQIMEPIPDETEMMVPPLQQELELLKKLAGVDSVYTPDTPENDCQCVGDCTCQNKIEPPSTNPASLALAFSQSIQ